MFTQLGQWINVFLTGYVATIVSDLCSELAPIAALLLTIYVATYGFAVARGEASESLAVFFWKMIKKTFVTTFALGAGSYMSVIVTTATQLQSGLATLFLSTSQDSQNQTPTSVFGALDTANNAADLVLQRLWQDASWYRIDLYEATGLFVIGNFVFMFAGLVVAVIANVVLTWMLAIGPIFLMALLFEQTSKYFDAWISSALSAVLVSTFVFFLLGLSIFVDGQVMTTLRNSSMFSVDGTVNAVSACLTYLIMMAVFAYVLLHAHEYASALTGGAAIQHGVGMAASYLGMRLASGGGAGAQSPGGAQGNSIQRGAGLAYGAGHVAGRSTRAAASAAGSAMRYAYQQVAARGRSRR